MTAIENNIAGKKFNRGLAFASSLVCSILGFAFVLFIPLSYGGPVSGHPDQRYGFSLAFDLVFWLIGLLVAILIPTAVWKRRFTVPWWMYPFFLVTLCVVLVVLELAIASHGWGLTVYHRPPP